MRKVAPLVVLGAALVVAAVVAFAARGGTPVRHTTLSRAAARTSATPLRFRLTVRLEQAGTPAQTLNVQGATGPAAEHVHIKVADMTAPDGSTLAGPSADEKVDGQFVYLRTTVTRASFGPLWIRERLAALGQGASELRTLRAVVPVALLHTASGARAVRAGGGPGGVFHARLAYDAPAVRAALASLEGGREYRDLRLTAWVAANGYVRLLLVTGRTPDRKSRFTLTVELRDFGARVAVTPPRGGNLVDFALNSLSE